MRKAKNLWVAAMQHTKNAMVVDYSPAMAVSGECMLSRVRRYQKEEEAARELIEALEERRKKLYEIDEELSKNKYIMVD